jgi:UDP:flavonoid glycosyltransferase YjiC (YdhE family)
MGTTHHAVVHAVPQIVVPHAADQRIQAKRVAQAKVGLHLSAHDVRQGMLSEGTHAILHDRQIYQTARNLADEMENLGGSRFAAEAILNS